MDTVIDEIDQWLERYVDPLLEDIQRASVRQEDGRNSSVTSELPFPPAASAEQTPPVEDVDPEVDAFLRRYPFLVPLLKESVDPLKKIFGDRGTLSIYVETDPEVEGWEYLVIAIRTTLPADQAQGQLDTFGSMWWLEHLPHTQGNVLFTLEFV